MRSTLCGVLIATALACADAHTAPQAAPQNPDAVVAEVAGRKITLKEVDERWQSMNPAERARVTQTIYQNRRNVLDQMLGDLLIEEAARAAGMPLDQYLKQETSKRIAPVSDDDVRQFFESNKDRTQGRSIDELQQPIRGFLLSQREQQAKAQLVDDLKKKSPANVMLEPPRQTVELAAHDPALGPADAPVTIVEFSDYQ
jgi:protein-disulfide isomerase